MKYIKGKNLENLCQEQPGQRFSVDTALTMMTPIVEALIYLHQQEPPIVHRNMNPANIVVPPDETEAILVGFGTTKEQSATGPAGAFRHELPGYAAIEQYGKGSGIDLRTDVYGLGATFYTLLTGVTPVDAISRVTMEQGNDPLKPISVWVPTIPLPVTSAVERAMSLHKKDRFATVEEFWQAMRANAKEQLQQDESPSAEIPPFSLVVDQAAESVIAEPLPLQPEEDEPFLVEVPLFSTTVDQAAEGEVAEPLPVQPEEDDLSEVGIWNTVVMALEAGALGCGKVSSRRNLHPRLRPAPPPPLLGTAALSKKYLPLREEDESPSAEISPLPAIVDQASENGVAEPLPVQSEEDKPLLVEVPLFSTTVDQAAENIVAEPLPVQLEEDKPLLVEVPLFSTTVDQAAENIVAEPLPVQLEEDKSPSLSWEKPPLSLVVDQASENGIAEPLPVQPEEDESLLVEVPLFSTTVDQAAENIVAEPLPVQREPKPGRKRSRIRTLSLALILLLGLGLSCFVYVIGAASHVPPAHKPTTAHSPTSVPNASPYPSLASSYAGTVSNISVPKTTTKLYLRDMQQDQNGLHGSFEGLGMAGPFTGKVTPSGKVLFKVKVHSSTTMLIFDGAVASSGVLEGTFNAVDQHGRSIGKYGLWYASVSSTLQDSSPAPATQTPAPAIQTPAPATQTLSASSGQYPLNKNNARTKGAAQPSHVHRTAEPSNDAEQPSPVVGTAQPSNGAAQPSPVVGKAKPPCNLNLILLCL